MDKQLTPIQKAIKFLDRENNMAGNNRDLEAQKVIKVISDYLKYVILPEEKQFAEGNFDAGYEKGQKDSGDMPGGNPPDFDNFYKQYEND